MPTLSATARREQQRQQFLAAMADCPSRQVLESISNKWVTLTLRALAEGPLRRGDLSRAVVGATQKMLTQTLRELERDGMLARTITPSVPVRVEYELTQLGHELLDLVRSISDWSEAHIAEITDARSFYDASQSH